MLKDYLDMIAVPEATWDLLEIALDIGQIAAPGEAIEPCRHQIKEIRGRLQAEDGSACSDYDRLDRINHVLFDELGLRGNNQDYYHPGNSCLPWVLKHRRGIPITLSLLYHELAEAARVPLSWIGMPGHFLLGYFRSSTPFFIDPFNQGEFLLEQECRERFQKLFPPEVSFDNEFLQEIRPRQVILRMLLNLKLIYRKCDQSEALLAILNRRIPLLDDPAPEILERGLVLLDLERDADAMIDLEDFVQQSQDDSLKKLIREQMKKLC